MRRTKLESKSVMDRVPSWGLVSAPADNPRATRAECHWRWAVLLVLIGTIPAFYADLLHAAPAQLADVAYLVAAMMVGSSLLHVSWYTKHPLRHVLSNPTDILLVIGLVAAAVMPSSRGSNMALAVQLAVSFITLLRMVWSLQTLITRGGLTYLLMVSLGVLLACGMGFWWLEPTTPTLADGMWLAFTTAATVGYGDVVPTTTAAKIFAVFVVLLGFGVLTLVTAAIATSWVETEDRLIQHEVVRDMRRDIAQLHRELTALRSELALRLPPPLDVPAAPVISMPNPPSGELREPAPSEPKVSPTAAEPHRVKSQRHSVGLDVQKSVEDQGFDELV